MPDKPNENSNSNSSFNGNNAIYLKAFLSLLTALVIALFVWVWTAQSTLTKLSFQFETMAADFDEVKSDTKTDQKQDKSLSKHWKLHSWARYNINELERKNDLPLSKWPDLSE